MVAQVTTQEVRDLGRCLATAKPREQSVVEAVILVAREVGDRVIDANRVPLVQERLKLCELRGLVTALHACSLPYTQLPRVRCAVPASRTTGPQSKQELIDLSDRLARTIEQSRSSLADGAAGLEVEGAVAAPPIDILNVVCPGVVRGW